MSTSTDATTNLLENVLSFYNDPALVGRAALRTLTQVSNGEKSISDPTNPMVFCLETACVMTSAAMTQNAINTRKQYAYAAQTQDDLYLHMSDKDYAGRFALPSTTKMTLMLNEAEVLRRMVTDPLTGIKKVVIPRNTEFLAGSTIFSIQYPIEIRQMLHAGLQVVWNTEKVSPLLELSSNLIDWEIRVPVTESDVPNGRFITLVFDVQQFNIKTDYANINSTGVSGNMPLTDLYYHARAYMQLANGNWMEIRTTHTDQIYDVATPTLVLKVTDNALFYSLPQVYISMGLLASKLRIDVYQTKGALEYDLGGYDPSAFSANWKAIDPADKNVYTAPLDALNSLEERIVFSDAIVTGGRTQLSFNELRTRVMKNAVGSPTIPITNVQIESALKDKGYDIVKNLDHITNREFLATRSMPLPDDKALITAATAGVLTLATSLGQAITYSGVIDNRESITLTPKVNYQIVNDALTMVSPAQLTALQAMPVEARVNALTTGAYMHSPYYYVLDTAKNQFNVRIYDLDRPAIISKTVVEENDSTQLQVTADIISVAKTDNGYTVTVTTRSSKTYQALDSANVFAQLGFYAKNEVARAYILGTLTGVSEDGERRFEFKLTSTLAMDGLDIPLLAQIYTTDSRYLMAPLTGYFDILFSTNAPTPALWQSRSIDYALGVFQLPVATYAINHERVKIKFGDALDTLWSRARSVPKELDYKYFEQDVPLLYDNDVYATAQDGSSLTIVDGVVTYSMLHHKGDPVLNADGLPVLKYRKGDVVPNSAYSAFSLQADGTDIMTRGVTRHVDLTVIDGLYWWATDNAAVIYREKLVKFMTSWMVNDLAAVEGNLLEKTDIYFHPKSSIGNVKVMVNNGTTTAIEAGQTFFVRLHVPATTYANPALQAELIRNTITVISASLLDAQVSLSAIAKKLQDGYGSDVIDVDVVATGSMAPYHAVTVLDEAKRLTIKKRLVNMTNDLLMIEEDVSVEFVKHYVE